MKYIMAVWVVVIVGASLWGVATRPPEWFAKQLGRSQSQETEAASVDASAERTADETEAILGNSPGRGYRPRKTVEARVLQVIDGDTIEVETSGERLIIGYLGIETPEVNHPVLGTEAYGNEALARNRQLVEGKTVLLEKDIIGMDRDGRNLRYVYVEELMINALLLHEGLARTEELARGIKYAEVLYELQNQAILKRRGGWRDAWPNIVPVR